LERLTSDEVALYDDLRRDRLGHRLRLEQERIPFGHVLESVRQLESRAERVERWVAASETRNWVADDPILDWLDLYGAQHGFRSDSEAPAYKPETDFQLLANERSAEFRARVIAAVAARVDVVAVPGESQDERESQTLASLRAGASVVVGGLLRNNRRRTIADPDLLVRSDVWSSWFPTTVADEVIRSDAPILGLRGAHYLPVRIAWRTFDVEADGHVGNAAEYLPYAVEAWCQADAIGEVQGYVPAAYLLGRSQQSPNTCLELENLARVDLVRRTVRGDRTLGVLAERAIEWMRRLWEHGSSWQVLPEPSVPELYPHARNRRDAPWHRAKREIAEALQELTLLPGISPERRLHAHARGIRRWGDPEASSATLGVTAADAAARLDIVLAANRSSSPLVLPEVIADHSEWREPAPVEFFVDFETTADFGDAGLRFIAQRGCGRAGKEGWEFDQWTVDALTHSEEGRIIGEWIERMSELCRASGIDLSTARICHWSGAERFAFAHAYRSALVRHPGNVWPESLPWFDVLGTVFRRIPIGISGAFDYGLKSIGKAMHQAGLVETTWEDDSLDGLAAMVGFVRAAEGGASLPTHPLIRRIGRYNEVDCRVMMEALSWMRSHR
jgi:hypothetical protein